jgi:hypothetical protein
MSFELCASTAIVMYAGKNVNTDATASSALLAQFCDDAQAELNVRTRYDWVTSSAAVLQFYKPYLQGIIAPKAAINLIKYDMSGYTSRGEAEDLININFDIFESGVKVLNEDKYKTKMGATNA